MLPYDSILHLDRQKKMPLFIQITNGIISEITKGRIEAGAQLPSSRKMAGLLCINRQTVVKAYQELELQGWTKSYQGKGIFVIENLAGQIRSQNGAADQMSQIQVDSVDRNSMDAFQYRFDDGSPDVRMAPLKSLGKIYSSLLKNRLFIRKFLDYRNEFRGDLKLRIALSKYLNGTRGIHTTPQQILITRGSTMAFYLILNAQPTKPLKIGVGFPGYRTFNKMVCKLGHQLIEIPVDRHGLDTDALKKILQKEKIDLLYAITHHHHPTTVTLIPERRMQLLQLADEFGFNIIEDDYDYDFHYNSSPILPLASWDHGGQVFYIGSFSKSIAPALRLGFLVATSAQVEVLATLRRFIDRSGDPVLERAVSILMEEGEIRRYLNRASITYRNRRDHLSNRLERFQGLIQFNKPSGGMAIWTSFKPPVQLDALAEKCKNYGLWIGDSQYYQSRNGDFTRLGFASLTETEIDYGIELLSKGIKSLIG